MSDTTASTERAAPIWRAGRPARVPWRLAALAVIAVSVSLLSSGVAAAHSLPSTKGFWVTNFSQRMLVLSSIQSIPFEHTTWDQTNPTYAEPNFQLLPVGYRLEPGMQAHFELDDEPQNSVSMVWDVMDGSGASIGEKIPMTLSLGSTSIRYSEATSAATTLVDAQSQDLYITDVPDTTVTIDTRAPGQMSQQDAADMVNRLCGWDQATCQFTVKGDHTAAQQSVVFAGPFYNYTCETIRPTVATSEVHSFSASWDIAVSVDGKVGDLIDEGIKVSTGGTTTSTITVRTGDDISIPPGQKGWFEAPVDVWRSAGTFRVSAANTTWQIDMTVDSPRQANVTVTPGPVTANVTPTEAASVPVNCP